MRVPSQVGVQRGRPDSRRPLSNHAAPCALQTWPPFLNNYQHVSVFAGESWGFKSQRRLEISAHMWKQTRSYGEWKTFKWSEEYVFQLNVVFFKYNFKNILILFIFIRDEAVRLKHKYNKYKCNPLPLKFLLVFFTKIILKNQMDLEKV